MDTGWIEEMNQRSRSVDTGIFKWDVFPSSKEENNIFLLSVTSFTDKICVSERVSSSISFTHSFMRESTNKTPDRKEAKSTH